MILSFDVCLNDSTSFVLKETTKAQTTTNVDGWGGTNEEIAAAIGATLTITDPDGGVTTFDSTNTPSFYPGFPTIDETKELLLTDSLEELSATQATSGLLNTYQIPSILHEGRIKEQLIPLRVPTRTLDNFIYSFTNVYEDCLLLNYLLMC